MTERTARRGAYALAVTAAVAAIVLTVAGCAGGSPGRTFPSLVPAAPPASWPRLTLPNGTAVLSYPPSLRPIAGDTDAVSADQVSAGGMVQLYLNATPRQGTERLQGWAAFRLRLLRSDDAASAHEVAAAERVRFRGGTGSCIIDTYVTRIGGHHYEELACLVQGQASASASASVIVAAAPAAMWAQERPLLLQAVAAYLVR
jgi:hypothetical protein